MRLINQQYGKAKVRVMKVSRRGDWHELKEIDASLLLAGDFATSYTAGDNSKVVPTDTVKNTVNILAKTELGDEIEPFALKLGAHFLKKYKQVAKVQIEITERLWERMQISGKPHQHSFIGRAQERLFTKVIVERGKTALVQSGIKDLAILKTTNSGFEHYPKCDFTTLPETKDRIMATNLTGAWDYKSAPKSYTAANQKILAALLKAFTRNYSPSVQATLYEMAEAALKAVPQIHQINLKLPNVHCLLINLAPFGLENKNEIFVPTTEPHGQIEATITR